MLKETSEQKILNVLRLNYPGDLSIGEISKKAGLSRPTTSTWVKVLEAKGRIEMSRKVGRAIFYRLKVNKE